MRKRIEADALTNFKELRDWGFHVIPAESEGKKPLVSWRDYQDTQPNENDIKKWSSKHRDCNVIVITGRGSGIVVLDIDSEEGGDIVKKKGLPQTPISHTRRGYHVWFKHPGGEVRNKVDLYEDVDLRGDGGYVLAPYSIHPSGEQYRWAEGRRPDQVPFADMPEWLLQEIEESNEDNGPTISDAIKGDIKEEYKEYCQRALQEELGKVASAQEGTRNNTLNEAAFNLYQIVFAGGLDGSVVTKRLGRAGKTAGLGDHEIKATLQSARESAQQNPRDLSSLTPKSEYTEARRINRRDKRVENSEVAIVGICMKDSAAREKLTRQLSKNYFLSSVVLAEIFGAIRSITQEGYDPDPASITDHVRQSEALKRSGKAEEVTQDKVRDIIYKCKKRVDQRTIRSAATHANKVVENYGRVAMAEKTTKIVAELEAGDIGPPEAAEQIQKVARSQGYVGGHKFRSPSQVRERAEELSHGEHLLTGLDVFDNELFAECGDRRGQTEVIEAFTGHGKSTFLAFKASQFIRNGYTGAWFQTEDQEINTLKLVEQHLGSDRHLLEGQMWFSDEYLYLDDLTYGLRTLCHERDIEFVVVDYLQGVEDRGAGYGDDRERIKNVSKTLTNLANELNVFLMMAAQPSKEPNREGWEAEPQIRDLHGSSEIEKNAYTITTIFRPAEKDELYDPAMDKVEWWNGSYRPPNCLNLRQRKVRFQERVRRGIPLQHTDQGIRLYEHQSDDTPIQNDKYHDGGEFPFNV